MTLEEQVKEAKAAYQRKWRAEHKENVQRHNRTYWERRIVRKMAEQEAKDNEQTTQN